MNIQLPHKKKVKCVATDPSTSMRTPVLADNKAGRKVWLHTKEREDDKARAREIAGKKNADLAAFKRATS